MKLKHNLDKLVADIDYEALSAHSMVKARDACDFFIDYVNDRAKTGANGFISNLDSDLDIETWKTKIIKEIYHDYFIDFVREILKKELQ